MLRLLTMGSVFFTEDTDQIGAHSEDAVSIAWSNPIATIRTWIARRRQRDDLRELSELKYLLDDIGLSREKALREAAKPFWQP